MVAPAKPKVEAPKLKHERAGTASRGRSSPGTCWPSNASDARSAAREPPPQAASESPQAAARPKAAAPINRELLEKVEASGKSLNTAPSREVGKKKGKRKAKNG